MCWIRWRRVVFTALAGVLTVCAAPGCRSTTPLDRGFILGELDAERFVERVGAGETRREEEHKYLRDNHLAWGWLGLQVTRPDLDLRQVK